MRTILKKSISKKENDTWLRLLKITNVNRAVLFLKKQPGYGTTSLLFVISPYDRL